MKLKQLIWFSGAYDLTREESGKNYGIPSMDITFVVKGRKGGVSLRIRTKWFLPQNAESSCRMYNKGYPWVAHEELCLPDIVDISQHSKKPLDYESTPTKDCEITGGKCYSDGTGLWGNECWREGFLHGGTKWLWPRLEQLYHHWLEDGDKPDLTPVPRKHPDEEKV